MGWAGLVPGLGLDLLMDSTPWAIATVEGTTYGEVDHSTERTHVFLQWKGIDACFDFWCECGANAHYDGYFAYCIQCSECGAKYVMPFTLYPLKIDEAWQYHDPIVLYPDIEDENGNILPITNTDMTHKSSVQMQIEDWAQSIAGTVADKVKRDLVLTVQQHLKLPETETPGA